jgi:hypothetical protein
MAWACPATFLVVLSIVEGAPAADTGMLYVKSDPPGATVVIGGVERGKTPVLVKGLPVVETEITLRIEGAKPVVVRETIEANKVARVSAEIDVPGASLTVISDPLEATVYLDKREHGNTPITIEGLLPGRHHLLLLKKDFPGTTRTIVLVAGEERVLEVKLGTAQAEEETGPAAKRPASRAPEAMERFLEEFLDLVEKGDNAGAQRLAERASAERGFAECKAHVLVAGEAAKLLAGLDEAAKRGARSLVGKETELATKRGTRVGRVEAVDDEGIAIVKEIKVGRKVLGGSKSLVAWSDLTPETLEELAKDWPPEGTAGAVAQALAAHARGDVRGAQKALDDAADDLLGQYLRERFGVSKPKETAASGSGEGAPSHEDALLRAEREFSRKAEEAKAKVLADLEKASDVALKKGDLGAVGFLEALAKNPGTQTVPPGTLGGRLGRSVELYRNKMHQATRQLMAVFESESSKLMEKAMVDEAESARKRVVALVEQHADSKGRMLLLCDIAVRSSESISVAELKTGATRLSGAYRDPIARVTASLTGAKFTRVPWKATVTHEVQALRQGYLYFMPGSPEEVQGVPRKCWERAAGHIQGKYIPEVHRVWLWKGTSLKARAYEAAVIARSIRKR